MPTRKDAKAAFFSWTPERLREALGNDADAELAGLLWGIDGFGNVDGETIPNRAESLDSIARRLERAPEALRVTRAMLAERLNISREQREKPLLDEKVLTG